jgi:hypothetical protein
LLFATPRAWLGDGKTIRAERAPTAFGLVSVVAHSDLSHGQVIVEISPPPRAARLVQMRLRLPEGWAVSSARIGGEKLEVGANATFDLTSRRHPFTVYATVERR